ncbi:MAG: hypothetical protein V4515_08095 [Chloroflexota bacterium]
MTTSDPEGAPSAPKKPRQRRGPAKAAALDTLPVERAVPAEAATAPGVPPPGIDEDGAWIEAEAVEVHQGAIGRVDATDVAVTQGAIGAARADRVSVEMGALGAALGGEVSISQGVAGTVLAQHARVEQAFVRTLIAQDVAVHRPSVVVFLLAQRVSGEVRVLMDWRGAVALGAVLGILAGLFGRGRRKG